MNQGDEVPLDELQRKHLSDDQIRVEGGREVVDRIVTLGKREVIPAVEGALIGMRVGGYRKLRASPHLGYRQVRIPDDREHRFQSNVNTDSGHVEQRFQDGEHGFRGT